MGLERLAAVVQQQPSAFHTDLMAPFVSDVTQALKAAGARGETGGGAYRVVADHLRAAAALVGEGVQPGPSGRGYGSADTPTPPIRMRLHT